MTKKELQFALMNGGLIKDKIGQWVKHGDKVAWVNYRGGILQLAWLSSMQRLWHGTYMMILKKSGTVSTAT